MNQYRTLFYAGVSLIFLTFSCKKTDKKQSITTTESEVESVEEKVAKTDKIWIDNMEDVIARPLEVEYLTLREKGFDVFPPEILKCKNLKDLDISMNNFSVLPAEIKELKELESLTIAYGRLNSLPPEIGELSKLTYLGLLHNKLPSLPETIGNLRELEFLNLTGNPIDSLPTQISNLTKLERFGLGRRSETKRDFTEQERNEIQSLLPNCKISYGKKSG